MSAIGTKQTSGLWAVNVCFWTKADILVDAIPKRAAGGPFGPLT